MKFSGYAAVPAALALLCAVSPALAESHPTATAGHSSTPASHHGFLALLDAMAVGAGKIPASRVEKSAAARSAKAEPASKRHAKRSHSRHADHTTKTSSRHSKPAKAEPAAEVHPPLHRDLRALVVDYARKAGLPPKLVHGVVMVESRYRPHVTGHGGYIGLMQLSYRTARAMGYRGTRKALYDPETNIRYGVHYLAKAYHASGGNLCATVSKYQGGIGVHGVTHAGAAYCSRVRHYMATADLTLTAQNGSGS